MYEYYLVVRDLPQGQRHESRPMRTLDEAITERKKKWDNAAEIEHVRVSQYRRRIREIAPDTERLPPTDP